MLLARLCKNVGMIGGSKQRRRRHSWSNEFDYHFPARPPNPPPPVVAVEDINPAELSSSDDDLSSDKDDLYLEFDLIAACHNVTTISSSEDDEKFAGAHLPAAAPAPVAANMGQGSSLHHSRPKLSLTWVLRSGSEPKQVVAAPEPPIKFQYSKTRRKSLGSITKTDCSDARKGETFIKKLVKRDESVKSAKVKTIKAEEKCKVKHLITNDASKPTKDKRSGKSVDRKITAEENTYEKSVQTEKLSHLHTASVQDVGKSEKTNVNCDLTKISDAKSADIVDKWNKYQTTKDNTANKNVYSDSVNVKKAVEEIRDRKRIDSTLDGFSCKSDKNITKEQKNEKLTHQKRTASEPTLIASTDRQREKQRQKRRSRSRTDKRLLRFGYDIEDIDAFLTKASLEKPANIPVVLSYPSVLYQTQYDGYQDEIPLPLGMVVNAVFKKESWLYIQTPHGEEGYVTYSACLPLGIIPQREGSKAAPPCWETSTDLFPRPCGNMTDSEKLTRSECGGSRCKRKVRRAAASTCGERSVDRLYLRAANSKIGVVKRQTLLVVDTDYAGRRKNTISVSAGDVVALISAPIKGWFWVRTRDGSEGFIPAAIAGHGYL